MDLLVKLGLVELALGGLTGWAMVLQVEHPDWLKAHGVRAPARIRQWHLDYILMGLILVAVGLAVPDLPRPIAAAVAFGAYVNPTLFLPLAFRPETQGRPWYRTLTVVSFLAMSGGLVAVAVDALV